MKIVVRPETHDRITEEVARKLIQRDGPAGSGRGRMAQAERLQTAAAARVDASRIVDLVENVLCTLTPRVSPDAIAL